MCASYLAMLCLLAAPYRAGDDKGTAPAARPDVAVVGEGGATAPRRFALVVGIDRYGDYSSLGNLRGCVADAQAISKVLVERCGYTADHVVALTDTQFRVPIQQRIKSLFQGLKPEDVVLFYFSGHGMRGPDGQDYLVPLDGDPNDPSHTMLSTQEVRELLRKSGAGQILMVMDCCRSTADGRAASTRGFGEGSAAAEKDARDLVVFQSCGPDEVSHELPDSNRGAYSFYVEEGLSGQADTNGDGLVTVAELQTYVRDHVSDWARQHKTVQVPAISLSDVGDPIRTAEIVVARVAVGGIGSWLKSVGVDVPLTMGTTEFRSERTQIILVCVRPDGTPFVPESGKVFIEVEGAGRAADVPRVQGSGKGYVQGGGAGTTANWHWCSLRGVTVSDLVIPPGVFYHYGFDPKFYGPGDRLTLYTDLPESGGRRLAQVEVKKGVGVLVVVAPKGPEVFLRPRSLSIDSVPRGARVTVDGEALGVTPLAQFDMTRYAAGRHQLTLSLEGYQDQTVPLALPEGGETNLGVIALARRAEPPVGSQAGQVKTMALPGGARMDLVWVPAGSFDMGSNDGRPDEKPVHRVELDGFWIGETKVTVGQWRSVMGSAPAWNRYGDDHPVVCVSWDDAHSFCQKTGLGLPTEAQWEYAARGPRGSVYPWGNQWDQSRCQSGTEQHVPVGSFPSGASWCGALDMAGSEWEWCLDWYDGSFYGTSAATARNPANTNARSIQRAFRGGGWSYIAPNDCRSAARGRFGVVVLPDAPDIGFRASQGAR